jgi:hypothetical protein
MRGMEGDIPETEIGDRVQEALQERFESYRERGMLLALEEE